MAIIAGFEKFKRIGKPGIQLLSRPCLVPHEKIVGRLSTRMQMVSLNDSTKTKDDAFVDYEATIIFEMINADDSARGNRSAGSGVAHLVFDQGIERCLVIPYLT